MLVVVSNAIINQNIVMIEANNAFVTSTDWNKTNYPTQHNDNFEEVV